METERNNIRTVWVQKKVELETEGRKRMANERKDVGKRNKNEV